MLSLRLLANNPKAFAGDHLVAMTLNGNEIRWAGLLQRIEYWESQILQVEARNIGLYHSNSVEFLAALLAIWRQGKIAVVPANTLDVMVQAVKTKTSVCIGEFGDDLSSVIASAVGCETVTNDAALILFTSGSSGTPTAILKSLAQLDAELLMLEHHWGGSVTNSVFAGTVSHHHMYGLPFRLLWPLTSGRPFLDREVIYIEQLFTDQSRALTLVSSPAHLDNLPESVDWMLLGKTIGTVFSAGAPLSLGAAKAFRALAGRFIYEVYGSTESGAVAWRNQLNDDLWRPLNGIRVKTDCGRLCIKSPAVNGPEWFVTDDLCSVSAASRFRLKGRSDRIIKVGGKRVSATAIEKKLTAHPWVGKARVTQPPSKNSRVSAVVELLPEGKAQLVDRGKRILCRVLSSSLESTVEAVARPRYWRFVTKIPTNTQGKTTAQELNDLFIDRKGSHLPQVLNSFSSNDCGGMIDIVIPGNLITLEGHFPGMPVLPGVVQIGWAIHFGTNFFGELGRFRRLEKLKFQAIIKPNERVSLKLQWQPASQSLMFVYSDTDNVRSSGRIIFTGASEIG